MIKDDLTGACLARAIESRLTVHVKSTFVMWNRCYVDYKMNSKASSILSDGAEWRILNPFKN